MGKNILGLCLFGTTMYFSVIQKKYWVQTLFNTAYTHTHIYKCENLPEKNLLFITEARTLIVIMSVAICRQEIKVFPAMKQNFGSHKYKDESKAENRCSTVLSTQDTVFHQHGTEKILSGYYAYAARTIWESNGLAVKLNLNGSY
jgi:hypothetical protein